MLEITYHVWVEGWKSRLQNAGSPTPAFIFGYQRDGSVQSSKIDAMRRESPLVWLDTRGRLRCDSQNEMDGVKEE